MQIVDCQSLGLDMVQNNVALNGTEGESDVIFCFRISIAQIMQLLCKLCKYYANIMQTLCKYYAEIMQKSCTIYVEIMQKLCRNHAEIMQKLCNNYAYYANYA